MEISVILPVYEEEKSITALISEIYNVLNNLSYTFEIIMVNDGSEDNTQKVLEEIVQQYPSHAKFIQLRRNYGQTAATACGIEHSQGKIIITLDADGQNSPKDIPLLLEKMAEGFEMVSGYRKNRRDGFLRVFVSKVANFIIKKITKVNIKDLGCSLKTYKRDIFEHLNLYGEMHRFLPVYAVWTGASYANVPVSHFPREHGKSKYGFRRVFRVLADIWFLRFAKSFFTKPIYFFWKLTLIPISLSALLLCLFIFLWVVENQAWNSYLGFSIISALFSLVIITLGVIAEVLTRIYFESQNKKIYSIRSTSENHK